MSDARWLDVEEDVAAAADHFTNAQALLAIGGFDDATLEGYRDRMALMHALQCAHTSAETALRRIFAILGEEAPSGDDWHQKLIYRAARAIQGEHARPAILSPDVASDLDETRRFRHRASRSYGTFTIGRSAPSLEAAKRLARSPPDDIARFRTSIDAAK